MPVPFIDIFAGPGGLGEGFSALKEGGRHAFSPALSIEMEPRAHETLTLRSFYRQFKHGGRPIPKMYFQHLRGEFSREELFTRYGDESAAAKSEAQQLELGGSGKENSTARVDKLIGTALDGHDTWILLGGPPCQAYSLVGRSRMGGISKDDPRVSLYKQYLRILALHRPAAFIFENVKGLASSKLKDRQIFQEVLSSLEQPARHLAEDKSFKIPSRKKGATYRLYGLVPSDDLLDGQVHSLQQFLIKAEDFGIPQARHRIIIIGVRDDLCSVRPGKLTPSRRVPVTEVLDGLPELRSGLSRGKDSGPLWHNAVHRTLNRLAKADSADRKAVAKVLDEFEGSILTRGAEFVAAEVSSGFQKKWYLNKRLGGACNHATRGHMEEDLHRYLYSSVIAARDQSSPKLADFPDELLPRHRNAKGKDFVDRFRVQMADRPATTITSHISKDGHYFIHPDPFQCRSLTVREAARIQTFPDDYLFCGPRTSQYTQVGNAVPPLLAHKIAKVLLDWFKDNGLA